MKRRWMSALAALLVMIAAAAQAEDAGMEAALRLAQEAVWAQEDAFALDDPAAYAVESTYSERRNGYRFTFRPLTLEDGLCIVWVEDGQAQVERLGARGYTGDSLFKRYQEVYGSPSEWAQGIWMQFGEQIRALETTTLEAGLLQRTAYAKVSAAPVTRDQALDIALEDYAQQGARGYSAVLIEAEPNPVWKVRVMGDPACRLYEVDGATGEILDREEFKADNYEFDPSVKMYTLRRDYEPALIAQYGRAYIAAVAVSKAYGDMRLDNPMLPLLDEEGTYAVQETEESVTFLAQEEGLDSYAVRFGADGLIEAVARL